MWRGFSLKALFVVVTCSCVFFAWRQYQYERGTINDWVDLVLAHEEEGLATDWISRMRSSVTPCPYDIAQDEQLRLLMKATRWERDSKRKHCLLKIIAEQFPKEALGCCRQIATKSDDPHFRRIAILLMGLFRDKADIDLCKRLLLEPDPHVRSAAVDAIAIIHFPSYPMPVESEFLNAPFIKGELQIATDGVKEISDPDGIAWRHGWREVFDNVPMPNDLVSQLSQMMETDDHSEVREAAARALAVRTKLDYRLRIAEWGVWINEGASLTFVQSIIDEIPPFVHRSGNRVASIEQDHQKRGPMIVTKPVIHVYADRPMAINLSVRIAAGRPWFGYPMPDDFTVTGPAFNRSVVLPQRFTGPMPRDVPLELSIQDLTQVRSGYPWLGPSHYKEIHSRATGIGFRWQSLIVLPEKADWMSLEAISDSKYDWWKRLRDVPSSWICNRGEAERFLYYDGPTEKPSPVYVVVDGPQLEIGTSHKSNLPYERELLYIEVNGLDISAVRRSVSVLKHPKTLILDTSDRPLKGEQVAAKLTDQLVSHGLSREEADGLVDCWRPQFFETDGRRLLTIFGKEEYEQMCPMTVSPKPTELARVGIVLTELKSNKATKGKQE